MRPGREGAGEAGGGGGTGAPESSRSVRAGLPARGLWGAARCGGSFSGPSFTVSLPGLRTVVPSPQVFTHSHSPVELRRGQDLGPTPARRRPFPGLGRT